jgi:hypothetical protein
LVVLGLITIENFVTWKNGIAPDMPHAALNRLLHRNGVVRPGSSSGLAV